MRVDSIWKRCNAENLLDIRMKFQSRSCNPFLHPIFKNAFITLLEKLFEQKKTAEIASDIKGHAEAATSRK